ncbi:MAG TPA: NIPSNAP family protein [Verrucomicrobiales bacterium]|nr:NIPSNAP family protein [Verrucomicrobiales bacterium]
MKHLLPAAIIAMTTTLISPEAKAADDTRLYEMRIYYAHEGKLDDLNARFRDHTCKLFEKHGMQNIGYWVPLENPDGKLVYILAYPDKAARDASWKGFMGDPDWQAAYKKSHENGPLVKKVEAHFMKATEYSPAIKAAIANPERTFELRTYTTTDGNLGRLDARFRDHTIKLFSKHGMSHFGYWHLTADQKDADKTLVYLLEHKSKEAAAESFGGFRNDPAWKEAREASEKAAGGSLTVPGGVKSEFLKPTDYSQTK